MTFQISPPALAQFCRQANIVATRLVRQFRLPSGTREDLRQDILVDLIVRFKAFDPDRGTLETFVALVAAHSGSRLAIRLHRYRNVFAPTSIDDAVTRSEDSASVGETIAESDGYLAMLGQAPDHVASMELRLDLMRALGTLDHRDRQLCIAVIDFTPTELSRQGMGSRATIYRRLKKIREQLADYGIADAVRRISGRPSRSLHGNTCRRFDSQNSGQRPGIPAVAVGGDTGQHARILSGISFGRCQWVQSCAAACSAPRSCPRSAMRVVGSATRTGASGSTPTRPFPLELSRRCARAPPSVAAPRSLCTKRNCPTIERRES
jgi:RNA polymerase sigma factor (sigma-70 family)